MNQNITWYDRFPKYYQHAVEHINIIKSRTDKNHNVPYKGDFKNDLLQVEKLSPAHYRYTGKILLRDILVRLQYLAHFNVKGTEINPKCFISMPILGQIVEFQLEESTFTSKTDCKIRGWQIIIFNSDGSMPKYDPIMNSLRKLDSVYLAESVLTALDTPLDCQMAFKLSNWTQDQISNVIKFILLTHVAEAAVPSEIALNDFDRVVKENKKNDSIKTRKEIIPHKHGRIPMMDKIVRAKLKKVCKNGDFGELFSTVNFPIQKVGGTAIARARALTGHEEDCLSDVDNDLNESFNLLTIK